MKRALAALVMLLPLMAQAKTADPVAEFSNCSSDAQCIVVEGICGSAGVNRVYKSEAVAYFKSKKEDANCVKKFWQPTLEQSATRCRLQRCEVVGKS